MERDHAMGPGLRRRLGAQDGDRILHDRPGAAGSSAISREDFDRAPQINYTPISYRDVRAFRASAAWEKSAGSTLVSFTPFVRSNSMEIIPNWTLTFDPAIWDTGHRSLGLLARVRRDFVPLGMRVIAGMDVDWSPGYHDEWEITPERQGKIFADFTRGRPIYDYDVSFRAISPYVQAEISPIAPLHLTAGLRYDVLGYDYENHLEVVTTGRLRRPASTEVSWTHVSPKLGASYELGDKGSVYAAYSHGFRAPSEGQLFRQGPAESTVDLEPIKADQIDLGVRLEPLGPLAFVASVYRLQKSDDVLSFTYPDGSTETVNAGETLHRGVELAAGLDLPVGLRLDLDWSYAKHTYEVWIPRPGVDLSGNEIEEAPRTIADAVLAWTPSTVRGASVSLEWVKIGEYWMDAANTHQYDGHDLISVRARWPIVGRWVVFANLMNATDERYAESATFNPFRGEEFAPGMPRTLYVGVQLR
jgi:iron complex outermembrane receptor protein